MSEGPSADLGRAAYLDLLERLPRLVENARLTLCSMGATVDARVALHDMAALLAARDKQPAALAAMLTERAGRGVGGEFFMDWPEGPAWLGRHVPVRYQLGGTGPHAAWALTTCGAPALVALEDRSAHMLARLPPTLLLAEGDALVPAHRLAARGAPRADIFIFEYTAGLPVGDLVPRRSSRIIVRFSNNGLEHDDAFDRLSVALAPSAGATLISGFSGVPAHAMAAETARVGTLARAWRRAGVTTVHLETAGYDSVQLGEQVLEGLRGAFTSIGMSHSEFLEMSPIADLDEGMRALGDRLGIDRVCVHADHWAASATRGDPTAERDALMMGCLLSSARAAAGEPVRPATIDPRALFETPPFPSPIRHGAWSVVSCPSPYLEAPQTTLGLGDTFTAGCLLVLGQHA